MVKLMSKLNYNIRYLHNLCRFYNNRRLSPKKGFLHFEQFKRKMLRQEHNLKILFSLKKKYLDP